LALVGTGGEGVVYGARPDHLDALLLKLREMGVSINSGEDWISVAPSRRLKACVISTDVYPGFPTDLQPQMTAVLCGAHGISTVSETIFENRLKHVPELSRMGAKIQLMGHMAIIEGPIEAGEDGPTVGLAAGLTGAPVEAHDLRCAAALVIAGLMARGETRIDGLRHLLRGYERLPEKIRSLGGQVDYEGESNETEDLVIQDPEPAAAPAQG
jgi:UDP-N-acetylglucosamine 1-carboxyvinyltransferase